LFAFFGLTRLVFAVVDGKPRPGEGAEGKRIREKAGVIIPPLVLMGISLWLGLATPHALQAAWTDAVHQLFPAP